MTKKAGKRRLRIRKRNVQSKMRKISLVTMVILAIVLVVRQLKKMGFVKL